MSEARPKPQLGFIGLGKMGQPMARRLIEHGYKMSLFDVDQAAIQMLAKIGGQPTCSPAEVASKAQVVFTCLPSLDAVRQVVLGKQGICRGERITTYIDVSTTGSEFARSVASRLERYDIAMCDAPVTGGVVGAQKGTLAVIVSGNPAVFRSIRPMLGILGKVFYVSDKPGRAQTMKLINQLLSTTSMAVACEGFVMGVKAGLDPNIMLEVINAGSGRNSATAEKFPRAVLPRTFDNGANMEISYKDISLCLKEAQRLGIKMLVGNAVKQIWRRGLRDGNAKRDSTRLIMHLEKQAGVQVIGKVAKRR